MTEKAPRLTIKERVKRLEDHTHPDAPLSVSEVAERLKDHKGVTLLLFLMVLYALLILALIVTRPELVP